jgi:hypothetical protein
LRETFHDLLDLIAVYRAETQAFVEPDGGVIRLVDVQARRYSLFGGICKDAANYGCPDSLAAKHSQDHDLDSPYLMGQRSRDDPASSASASIQ